MSKAKGKFLDRIDHDASKESQKASLLARKNKATEKKINSVIEKADYAIGLTALPERKKEILVSIIHESFDQRKKTTQVCNNVLEHILKIKAGFQASANDYYSLKLKATL